MWKQLKEKSRQHAEKLMSESCFYSFMNKTAEQEQYQTCATCSAAISIYKKNMSSHTAVDCQRLKQSTDIHFNNQLQRRKEQRGLLHVCSRHFLFRQDTAAKKLMSTPHKTRNRTWNMMRSNEQFVCSLCIRPLNLLRDSQSGLVRAEISHDSDSKQKEKNILCWNNSMMMILLAKTKILIELIK